MEYKDFINKLYIKGAGIIKAKLTKYLFLNAVNDTSIITNNRISDESYKGYNRGNSINRIAYDVINSLKQSGIESCIEEYLNKMQDKESENVRKICCKFKEDIPDITPENKCKKIADFFIDEVLRPAAKEYEKTISRTKDISTRKDPASVQGSPNAESAIDGYSEDNSNNITNISTTNINETVVSSMINNTTLINDNRSNTIVINTLSKNASELEGLKALITELNTIFMNLDEIGLILHMSSWLKSDDEQNEKEQQFEALKVDFIKEHNKLRRYYLSFSELREMFDELRSLSHTLTFWYGYRNDEQNKTRIECDHQIEKYRKCIEAVWNALSE